MIYQFETCDSVSTQALLHLLLKISDSVTRLESLLLIVNKNEQNGNETSDMPSTLQLTSNSEDQGEDMFVTYFRS